jgi:FKBP-type peptidyl-prolyl cis-trans isomerase SlyD
MNHSRRLMKMGAMAAVLLIGGFALWAAETIRKGSKVSMHYTLKVEGQVVDSSEGKAPMTYVQGSGQVIPGVEDALRGLKKGDKKHVSLSPEKGYGKVNPDAFQVVPRSALKKIKDLKVGSVVTGQTAEGQPLRARVIALDGDKATLDLNHPLAGKTLEFDLQVVEVRNGG